jgi:rRNA-processing protein FCF1
MNHIILDTNIIIAYPKLLGLSIKGVKFVIPIDVITELTGKSGENNSRAELIQKAVTQGTISIIDHTLPGFAKYYEPAIGDTDSSIIAIALNYITNGLSAKIATFDKKLSRTAIENHIEILSKDELEKFIQKFENPEKKSFKKIFLEVLWDLTETMFPIIPILKSLLVDLKDVEIPSIQGKILFFERKENVNLIAGIIIGIVFTLLSVLIYLKLNVIISTINIWGTIIATLIFGVILFVVRERQRLGYGIFEFLVGVISIIILFYSDDFDYSKINFTTDVYLKIAAGLYIMVRGQDNIVKAIKDTRLGLTLRKYKTGL